MQAIRESLANRLDAADSSRSQFSDADDISVADLLAIDRQYRSEAVRGRLPTVAQAFQPDRSGMAADLAYAAAWAPILHHYANTAHSHRFGRASRLGGHLL